MIGGIIIDIAARPEGVRLWLIDPFQRGDKTSFIHDECMVMVAQAEEMPVVGDTVWWQAGRVFWTPADKRFQDRPLQKVGNSYRPEDEHKS